jgi:hypothetical protein
MHVYCSWARQYDGGGWDHRFVRQGERERGGAARDVGVMEILPRVHAVSVDGGRGRKGGGHDRNTSSIAVCRPPFPLCVLPTLCAQPCQTHTHTHTNTQTHTNTHKHTQTYTNTQTHKHTNTQTHKHTQTHTNIHKHTNTQTHKHTQTYTNTQTHKHTNTQTHKHTNTQTRDNIHTPGHEGGLTCERGGARNGRYRYGMIQLREAGNQSGREGMRAGHVPICVSDVCP